MKRIRSITRAASRLLVACAATAALGAGATGLVALAPSACDHEWERMKNLLPMSRVTFETWLKRSPAQGVYGSPSESEADYYYFLARVPFVIEDPALPTMQQREEWLQKAADKGHKAAKAALMRLRYLGVVRLEQRPQWPRYAEPEKRTATRQDYLKAAREAAEVGDPEFAAVMMDTAQNINRPLHCHADDTRKLDSTSDPMSYRKCDPQEVTQPSETHKWAGIAARGGNPDAKMLMCRMSVYGTASNLGFAKDPATAFEWCVSTLTTPCLAGAYSGLVAEMYQEGKGTPKSPSRAEELRAIYPLPVANPKPIHFPYIAR